MKVRRESIPGTGLPLVPFMVVLTASIVLFMGWNGALWKAPREASHGMRFIVSYCAVIPLAAGFLLGLRRFTWGHLITTTGAVWAIKMCVTAVLYQAFARGTATNLTAVAPPPSATTGRSVAREYRPAAVAPTGILKGQVVRAGQGVSRAIVFLDAPGPGLPQPNRATGDLVISGSRYAQVGYLVHLGDDVRLVNRDGQLHTAHFSGAPPLPASRATPASAAPISIDFPEPGVFHVRCDTHPGEGAWVVVVDHPYAVWTDSDGSFTLTGVPAGQARVISIDPTAIGARRAEGTIAVREHETSTIRVDLDSARDISP